MTTLAIALLLALGASESARLPFLPPSVACVAERTAVYRAPRRGAPRRGTAAGGYRLPVFRVERGAGCGSWWLEVHGEGWVCADRVVQGDLPPDAPPLPDLAPGALTPFPYAFVREGGAPLFDRAGDVVADHPMRLLEKGYAVSIRGRRTIEGERFYETVGRAFIRASDTFIARPSTFRGVELPGREDVGWTFRPSTRVFGMASGRATTGTLERHVLLRFVAEHSAGGDRRLEMEGGGMVRAADVRRPTYRDPPSGVGPYDRWFDIDRTAQIIVAYEGERPAYATLVSSGRRGHETPAGVHRIWIKTISDRMANEAPEDPEDDPYYLEDVPWVVYFHEDFALHGVYWHDQFGNRRSHGCVNLSPIDARWIFDFARPSLPRGWWSIHPTEDDPGSIVVVR